MNKLASGTLKRFLQIKPKYILETKPVGIIKPKIAPLTQSENNFQIYKNIITNQGVVFTSSWVNQAFGIENIKKYCQNGNFASVQKGLNSFFNQRHVFEQLQQQFKELSHKENENCGYCIVIDDENIMGGCGLIPLERDANQNINKADVFLHILPEYQKGGIGTVIMERLLKYGFDEIKLQEIWGTSLKDHTETPTVCSKFGMIIKNNSTLKYYFIDKEMWNAVKQKLDTIQTRKISASQKYFDKSSQNRFP